MDQTLATTGRTATGPGDFDPAVEQVTGLVRVLLDRVFDDVVARLDRQLPLTGPPR
ncbi:MAG: hypothetical protein ACM3ZF_02000 [Mycobacterium leprae]